MSTATIQPRHLFRTTSSIPNRTWMLKAIFLTFCLSTIAAVSASDIWFAVANSSIMIVEKNPICLALMKLEPNGFSYFVLGKSVGTLLVIFTLLMLHQRNYRHAMTVTIALTCFQLGLLTYLTLSDPLMYNLPNFGLLFGDSPECIWRVE